MNSETTTAGKSLALGDEVYFREHAWEVLKLQEDSEIVYIGIKGKPGHSICVNRANLRYSQE